MGPNTYAALHAGADHMVEVEKGMAKLAAAENGEGAQKRFEPREPTEAEVLSLLRAQRRSELVASKRRARFGGGVKLIDSRDWQREVVDCSLSDGGTWVVVHLQLDSQPRCAALREALEGLSRSHATVSFVSVPAAQMMPSEHFHCLPSLMCYRDGKLRERLIGRELVESGAVPSAEEMEWKLAGLGVLESDLEEAPARDAKPPRRVNRGAAAGHAGHAGESEGPTRVVLGPAARGAQDGGCESDDVDDADDCDGILAEDYEDDAVGLGVD